MIELKTKQDFDNLIADKSDYILYKNSPTCSRSIIAKSEVQKAIEELNLQDIYILDVLYTWDLKYEVADYFEIEHESPQVIIVRWWKVLAEAHHNMVNLWRFHQVIKWRHDTRHQK